MAAASSLSSLRSSRRVTSQHSPLQPAPGEKQPTTATGQTQAKQVKREKAVTRPPTRSATVHARPNKREDEMPARKRARVELPIHQDNHTAPPKRLPPRNKGTPLRQRGLTDRNGGQSATTKAEVHPVKVEVTPSKMPTPQRRPQHQQPAEKRQLRSQRGASRVKSDLALFFPCYDEMIATEPKEPGTF